MACEIISLQIGQCGNCLGSKVWEIISSEHGLESTGGFVGDSDVLLNLIEVYFSESSTGRFVPRSVCVDTEPTILERIIASPLGRMMHPDCFIYGAYGAANNFAKGFNGHSIKLANSVDQYVRTQAEKCERLQGFQFLHSVGGGTGSGVGCQLQQHLRSVYAEQQLLTYSIVPSPKVSDSVVEPYNSIFAFHHIAENTTQSYCLDNEALYNICGGTLKLKKPCFDDLNVLCSFALNGCTSSLRFPGQLNTNLRKIATNLIPFPRLHFFCCGFAPLQSKQCKDYRSLTVQDMTQQAFAPQNSMCAIDTLGGKFLAVNLIYRGDVSIQEVDIQSARIQKQFSNSFIPWLPSHITTSLVDVCEKNLIRSVTFIGNNCGIAEIFERLTTQFRTMLDKRAFMHWYLNEGATETDFDDAYGNVMDIISDYTAEMGGATTNE